ncbi:MAG TPA: glutamate-1-semialdehyde 2,1-aminomutase [Candidatus Xenobia bacterium]|jgi:glutamate-1-semialdehyde 2,1-aminomutase
MLQTRTRSEELFRTAETLMPGGVNSPVRAFRAVGGQPVYMASGQGSHLLDVDGNRYIDYVGSWGPMILGHSHPRVVEAVRRQAEKGLSFGTCTELEVEMASVIRAALPSMEMLRMVSSGTEATMSAIRVARGYTGRSLLVKFEGCYHGHADSLLARAGSGGMTFDVPDSAGVPADVTRQTITLPFNDLAALESCFQREGRSVAAVIVEPVVGNMGLVPPRPGFLEALRRLTEAHGAVLIFDEVMTGFRVAWGGAQLRFGITPDLTTLGKIVGGGLPVGAYGGRADIMAKVSPLGPVYQAGTLSGNPVSMAAGLETLRVLQEDRSVYDRLEARSAALASGLERRAAAAGLTVQVQRVGSMMTVFFAPAPVVDMATAKASDVGRFGAWFGAMLARGVYLAPSQYEAFFVSAAHSEEDVAKTLSAAEASLAELAGR